MIAFIHEHGKETVAKINKAKDDEFTVQKNQYVDDEKKKIRDNFEAETANQEVRIKIEKSKQQNAQRIAKMRMVNEYVDRLVKETRDNLRTQMKNDPAAYKELMKNLLIQVSTNQNTFFFIFVFFIGIDQTHGAISFYQMQKGRCRHYRVNSTRCYRLIQKTYRD